MNIYDIESVKLLLEKQLKITIIPHKSPDGDAIGSCLGLYHYLLHQNQDVTIVSPDDFPDFLKWLPGVQDIVIYEKEPEKAQKQIEKSKLIFTLDFNTLKRSGALAPFLETSVASFIMIDHHQEPDDYAHITFSNPEASSTCAMIYTFIDALGDKNIIDKDIATCLYTGIMTDTGNFKYASTKSNTLKIASFLIEKGAENSKINANIYDNNSYDKLQLLSVTLKNMVFLEELRTTYMTLTEKQLAEHNFEKGDTEGFVNYGLSIKGSVLAVIFIQESDFVKISFRSKNDYDVSDFSRTYFKGGGHINAAGGRFEGTIEQAVNYFLEIVPNFIKKYSKQ